MAERDPINWSDETVPEKPLLKQVPAVPVPISSLMVADSPRSSGLNMEHIELLANAQSEPPPIIVHRAGMRVLDGMHRLKAAERRGQSEIEVRFFDGDDADAFVIAVRSNVAHGLPLSLADRKAAATRIMVSHPQWSDRLIASAAGLAPKTIAELRSKPDTDAAPTEVRIGADGRARPVNSAERRSVANELLIGDPNMSLRQVAKIAGISPETARGVRKQLYNDHKLDRPEVGMVAVGGSRQPRLEAVTLSRSRCGEELNHVVRQLKSDPSLRSSEGGRTLLRLLDVHAIEDAKWAELCDHVPAHCKGSIVQVALRCAEAWKEFSERLLGKASAG